MKLLNIKGTEFQNSLEFPCVFYNPTFYLHPVSFLHKLRKSAPDNNEVVIRLEEKVTAWKLINTFKEYVEYTENMSPQDIIYVYLASFPSSSSSSCFEEAVNLILDTQGDSLLYIQDNNYLVEVAGISDWISFLRTLRDAYNNSVPSTESSPSTGSPLVTLGQMFVNGRLLRDNTRNLDKRHYS